MDQLNKEDVATAANNEAMVWFVLSVKYLLSLIYRLVLISLMLMKMLQLQLTMKRYYIFHSSL